MGRGMQGTRRGEASQPPHQRLQVHTHAVKGGALQPVERLVALLYGCELANATQKSRAGGAKGKAERGGAGRGGVS